MKHFTIPVVVTDSVRSACYSGKENEYVSSRGYLSFKYVLVLAITISGSKLSVGLSICLSVCPSVYVVVFT